jgi:hypothetical protein
MTVTWRSSLARRLVPAVVGSIAALASITSAFAGTLPVDDQSAITAAVNQPPVLVLPSAQTGDVHDPLSFTVSATDPEASDTLTFGASGLPAGLALTNNGNRTATVSGTPGVPGTYTATFSVSDGHNPAVTGTLKVTITKEQSALVYTGRTVIANGLPVTLSARLLEDGNPSTPIAGRNVVLTLGSGTSAQSCTAGSAATGSAACAIAAVKQPLGPGTVSASFGGDAVYLPSSTSARTIVFAFLAAGAFVVGDKSSAVGTAVTFWGAQWASKNALSGGAAPADFKGFAAHTSKPPANGNAWTTGPGNSSRPPGPPLPGYMAVVVSSSISRSGATISGNTVHIVVVKVNPGYAPDPSHGGTGTVVAIYT